jgi:hypothetical protein
VKCHSLLFFNTIALISGPCQREKITDSSM